jgi:hydrogenase nickel incorporation protein HypB
MTSRKITIKENILSANSETARINRNRLDNNHIRMINLMSASGSGKTELILRTIDHLKNKYRIGAIASSIDADKIVQKNVPVMQINLSGGCHLDARMVEQSLGSLDLDRIDLILLENVGNLVCTADFDLGSHKNVVILSIPEGDDKPLKYPLVFVEADAIVINKMDVLPYFDFNLNAFSELIGGLNPSARIFRVSTKTGEGMDDWLSWIEKMLA